MLQEVFEYDVSSNNVGELPEKLFKLELVLGRTLGMKFLYLSRGT